MRAFFDTMYEKIFFRDISLAIGVLMALIGQVLIFSLIISQAVVLVGSGNEFLSLHYKIFMGTDYFARWQYIFLLPLSGVICAVINYLLARILFYSQRTSAQMLVICAALFQYLLLFAVYLLIQINLS